MAGAFQQSAFQDSAFQTSGGAVVTPTVFVGDTGGKSYKRKRERIILRIEGQEYLVSDLAKALEIIKAVKKDIPAAAKVEASKIVVSGKSIGEAKKAEQPIEVVSAPSSVKGIIEDRIAEMERMYWARIAAQLKDLEDDDEDVWLMLN